MLHMSKTRSITVAVSVLAAVAVGALLLFQTSKTVAAGEVTVYKSPTCGCCKQWVTHLRDHGFTVKATDVSDVDPYKRKHGLPRRLGSCHTALVDGYVIEGHVPADDIKRLLTERPNVKGLAVPGMPMGSPGMEGPRKDPYAVLSFDAQGNSRVYARH